MTTNTLTYSISQNKLFIMRFPRVRFVAVLVLGLIGLILLLSFYVFQINEMAGSSYLVENYNKKINRLFQENQSLEMNFVQINSLENIEKLVNNLNFEKVKEPSYIQILDGAVAVK